MIKINKNLFLEMFFILGILIVISFASAYTQSYYSSQYNNAMGLGIFSNAQSLRVDESMCQQGTDFLIQIGPLSCTPTVVRSDLLEEENVNVFCQLTATQINPFVDVKNIKWITFSGRETPKEVLSLGYQPAQAALGYTGSTGLQGSALLNNLGYVVVTLRNQPNESALTNCEKGVLGNEVCWVEGNLTASLTYDVQNAFGVGSAVFYLPVMSDEDWQQNYLQYSFWDGRGYLRANAVGDNDATISIYSDSSVASGLSKGNRQYNLAAYNSNINIKSGTSSNKIFLPGLSPCLASLKLNLDGIVNPDTRATLKINDDYVEVAEGEKFLDNKCTVSSIDKKGINSAVTIKCNGADDASQRASFDLRVFPKVNLSINGKTKAYSVGDWLYKSEDGAKSVYLGYVGTRGDTTNTPKDLYIYLVALPVDESTLTDSEISSVVSHAESIRASSKTGAETFDVLAESLKKVSGVIMQGFKWAIKGEAFNFISYNENTNSATKVEGSSILLKGLSNPEDAIDTTNGGADYLKNYQKAMSDFETVVNSFPKEVENTNSIQTLGEKSLYEEIVLANSIGNKKTVVDLCKRFETDYPDTYANLDICKNSLELSNSEQSGKEITINGITKSISFDGIKEPSINDYSATVLVQGPNGNTQSFDLRKNQQVPLDGFRKPEDQTKLQTGEYLMLTDLGTNTASIKVNIDQGFFNNQFVSDTESFTKGVSKKLGGNSQFYTITLTSVKLEKVAKVSIIPSTDFANSNTSFKFKIGIEKRNTLLKLSPAKTQERINFLNSSIAEWQKASDALYNVVRGMKAACVSAGAVLTFKNLVDNYGGKAIARQQVMNGISGKGGGWNEKCTKLFSDKQYKSMDDCFLQNANLIDAEVNKTYYFMDIQNKEIKQIENANPQGTGISSQVNTAGFVKDYSKQVLDTLNSLPDATKTALKTADIAAILTPDGWTNNKYTIDQLREIELYSLYLQSNPGDATATKILSSVISDVNKNAGNFVQIATVAGQMEISPDKINYIELNKNVQKYPYEGLTAGNTKNTNLPSTISSDTPIAVVQTEQGTYTLVLDNSVGTKIYPVKVNKISQKDATTGKEKTVLQYQIYDSKGVLVQGDENIINKFSSSVFQIYDATSYKNTYKSSYGSSTVLLRYYEDSPYKGFPSVVPFDLINGWYAGIKSPQTSYTAAGVVNSFWICNVGKNGIEEFQLEGFGDDICELFNLNTGQKYTQFPGLTADETYTLVTKADNAIQAAQKAYKEGVTSVSINGQKIKVGTPTVQTPAIQCTDFMSPKDCSLLFNLCDPVICPSSRCNLGGNYPVKDVIQSGIIGSIALCYPNAKWNGGDVYVPVCLTGIQAGMDNWISIQKSYRDCLQTSLNTGQTVGICDEINSIYTCEFFWKQALPIIKSALPKLLGVITGQNKKGGGEYQGITSALATAKSSIDYFKQYYAANSYRAFQVRSTEQVGTQICSTFASLTYPDSGSFLDNLIQPDSPVQFTGKFNEIQLTTLTNPPTSQYKVYYNIYSGKDSGAYYQVYLRGAGSSYYQDTSLNRMVKSGYVEIGGYASDTVDFTAPSGYQQMCIVVNGQEVCGFKEVSTSFAVNYVNDLYLAEQATTNVTTQTECISGTASFYSLLNLNAESAANNLINPAIYTQGIIRICSTADPGVGTDASAGTQSARWKQMGYCGDKKIGCWIDTESVKNVIKTMNIEQSTLNAISNSTLQYLSTDYLDDNTFKAKIDEIKQEPNDVNRIQLIQAIFNKVFFNNEKAQLFFWRGVSYSNLARNGYESIVGIKEFPCQHFCGIDENGNANVYYGVANSTTGICEKSNLIQKNCVKGCNSTFGICVEDLSLVNVVPPGGTTGGTSGVVEYVSPEFIYGSGILQPNIHLKYNKEWYYCLGDITHLPFVANPCTDSVNWHKISEVNTLVTGSTHQAIFDFSNDNLDKKNYKDGLRYLIDKSKANQNFLNKVTFAVKGDGFSIEMSSDGSFVLQKGSNSIDLIFRNDDWVWEAHSSSISNAGMDPWSFTFTPVLQSHLCGYCESSIGACTPTLKNQIDKECELSKAQVKGFESLIPRLHNLDFYTGAKLIFEFFVSGIPASELNPSAGTIIPSNNQVCTPPVIFPDVLKLTDANQKVLEAAKELEGDSSSRAFYSNCWQSAYYIYTSVGVSNKCVYSDVSGKQYSVQGTTIKIGVDKNGNGETIFQIASLPTIQCSLNKKLLVAPTENQKLDNIQSGDLLSIVYSATSGHNAVFIKWVDQSNKIAQLFDWNGVDANGNKIFQYYEENLSDNAHAVYMYWEPVIA